MPQENWREAARQCGFEAAGVCDFAPFAGRLLPCRAARRLPENARRILTVLFPYQFAEDRCAEVRCADAGKRNLSRYACVEDYHKVGGAVLERLAEELRRRFPGHAFEPFMDNSPIPEVEAAVRSGLGVRGDNGLLIHPDFGSWVFIGTVVTDAPLPFEEPGGPRECSHCGQCAARCPGGCLPGEERSGCLSAITQKKGDLTPDEAAAVRRGGLAWGCDACQEACPLNQGVRIAPHPCFTRYRPLLREEDLDDLRDSAYGWRGRDVPLRNLRLLQEDGKEKSTGRR